MKKINLNLLHGLALVLVFTCFTSAAFAQIFWSEDFTDGIPIDWTNEDLQDNGGEWTWCDDPGALPGTGCPGGFTNDQGAFDAATATTGFVTVASDNIGSYGNTHTSELTTSAIDCSAYTSVYVYFETYIGTFELAADDNAILQVSINGTDWTDFTIFPYLTTANNAWSNNPQATEFDLSSIAGGESTVYLRWHWNAGYEYYWSLDDIALSEDNVIPANDLRVNSNWFATALNSQVPASQVEAFGFMADIQNIGFADQTNVGLNVTIVDDADPGTNVYDQTLDYGIVLGSELVENQLFPDAGYTPPASEATYNATYSISADSTDFDLSNNEISFAFAVSENVFAKDSEPWFDFIPANNTNQSWDDGEAHSWAHGNHYYVPNGNGMVASEASFALGNAADMVDEQITIKLYRWTDVNNDGNLDTGTDERSWIGYYPYVIVGDEAQTDLITVPILNSNDDEPGVPLMDGGNYVLVVEYVDTNGKDFRLMADSGIDYGAAIFRTEELEIPRYAGMLGTNEPLDLEPLSSVGFGRDIVPVVRMTVDEAVSINTILDDDNIVEVFPNPASEYIHVNIELANIHTNVVIEITNANGKLIEQRSYNDFQKDQLKFELNKLTAGSYFLNVSTPDGQKSTTFSVVR